MGTLITTTLILYFLFLLFLRLGWERSLQTQLASGNLHHISVVIPFRNEENNLIQLIRSLSEIEYPPELFEVLLVDDHSDDKSLVMAQDLTKGLKNFGVLQLEDNREGKKQALTKGIEHAKGDIILTTDADCKVRSGWLKAINGAFATPAHQLVFGAVALKNSGTFFSRLQAMEFTSLMGSAVATMGFGWFTMCNGANLAFRKKAFQKVSGYEGNLDIPSGDDEFLARKILKVYPRSIGFVSDDESVVDTPAQHSLTEFVSQRIRWAGKWRYNHSLPTRLLAMSVAWVQLIWLFVLVGIPLQWLSVEMSTGLTLTKLVFEMLLLVPVHRFTRVSWNSFAFITLQFVYPLYVLAIGLASMVSDYRWKGRSLKHRM